MHKLFLDTETTGFSPAKGDRMCEIALIDELGGVVFHAFLNPGVPVSPGALKCHGLTNEFLADKISFSEVAAVVADCLKGKTLIAHNAPFDVRFLNHELALAGLATVETLCTEVIDTLALAKETIFDSKHTLEALAIKFAVKKDEKLHSAAGDAILLARVYQHLQVSA